MDPQRSHDDEEKNMESIADDDSMPELLSNDDDSSVEDERSFRNNTQRPIITIDVDVESERFIRNNHSSVPIIPGSFRNNNPLFPIIGHTHTTTEDISPIRFNRETIGSLENNDSIPIGHTHEQIDSIFSNTIRRQNAVNINSLFIRTSDGRYLVDSAILTEVIHNFWFSSTSDIAIFLHRALEERMATDANYIQQ